MRNAASRALVLWEAQRADSLLQVVLANAPPDTRVVADLGCGTGAMARLLASTFPVVVGLDSSDQRLRTASSVGAGRRAPAYVACDVMRLPIRTCSLDLAFSYGVFHHVDVIRACAEIRRVLRPGGVAIIADFLASETAPRPGVWRHIANAVAALPGYARRLGLRPACTITWFRLTPTWIRHVMADQFLTRSEFVEAYSKELPGLRIVLEPTRAFAIWTRPED